MELAAFALVFLAGIGWAIYSRGRELKMLMQDGVPVTGAVKRKLSFNSPKGGRRYYLWYEFRPDSGKTYGRKIAVDAADFDRYEDGDPIDLIYLPGNPSISAARTMVDAVRSSATPDGDGSGN